MTTVVLDASVIVKWIFTDGAKESHSEHALVLLRDLEHKRIEVIQPPHWLAEVSAVVTRLEPSRSEEAVGVLYALELPVQDDLEVYQRACRIAVSTGQHLFDTLYHAVALEQPDAVLVTADDRYYRKGQAYGRIMQLRDYG